MAENDTAIPRKKKAIKAQRSFIGNYLEEHPQMVDQKFTSTFTYTVCQEMWNELAKKLNERGPPKTVEKWKLYWKDQKTRVKQLEVGRKREIKRTGGGAAAPDPLSPTKQKILSVIGGKVAIEGEDVLEYGINSPAIITPPPLEPAPAGAAFISSETEDEDDPADLSVSTEGVEVLHNVAKRAQKNGPGNEETPSTSNKVLKVAQVKTPKGPKRTRKRKLEDEDNEVSMLIELQKSQTTAIASMAESFKQLAEAFLKK